MTEYTHADLEQMVAGFVAILSEAALGSGSDTFTFFVDTVVPGMIASGDPLPTVMHGGMMFSNLLIGEVGRHIADDHYEETSRWLAAFIAHYHISVMQKGLSLAE